MHRRHFSHSAIITCAISCAVLTGCQVREGGSGVGGSSMYEKDGVVYYPPGPEFKLQREAAARKALQQDVEEQQRP
jgi:hypothetical protein